MGLSGVSGVSGAIGIHLGGQRKTLFIGGDPDATTRNIDLRGHKPQAQQPPQGPMEPGRIQL